MHPASAQFKRIPAFQVTGVWFGERGKYLTLARRRVVLMPGIYGAIVGATIDAKLMPTGRR